MHNEDEMASTTLKLILLVFAIILVGALGYLVWKQNTTADNTDNGVVVKKITPTVTTTATVTATATVRATATTTATTGATATVTPNATATARAQATATAAAE